MDARHPSSRSRFWRRAPRGAAPGPGRFVALFAVGGPAHATRAVLGSLDVHIERSGHEWYAAAREAVAALPSAGSDLVAARAYLFPTEDGWVRTAVDEYVQGSQMDLVLTCISDVEALARAAPHVQPDLLLYGEKDYVPSVLDGVGTQALVLFRELQSKFALSAEARREWADTVSRINTDEAATLLFDNLEREVLPFASEAAARWPRRSLRALAERAAVRGKTGDVARSLLASLVRREPALVDGESPSLPEESRRAVEAARGAEGPNVPDATPDRLPPVLASPPWAAKQRPIPLPVVASLTPPVLADEMKWSPGEREGWARRHAYESGTRYQEFTPNDWVEVRRSHEHPRPTAAFFAHAPEDLVLARMGEFTCETWGRPGARAAGAGRRRHPGRARAGPGPSRWRTGSAPLGLAPRRPPRRA